MRTVLAVVTTLILAGCNSLPTVDVPKEVRVEVLAPCVKPETRPARPPFRSDAELEAMADYHYTLAMVAERIKVRDYIVELEAVVEGCSRIPALTMPPAAKPPASSGWKFW